MMCGTMTSKWRVSVRNENNMHVVVGLDLIERSLALMDDEDNVEPIIAAVRCS